MATGGGSCSHHHRHHCQTSPSGATSLCCRMTHRRPLLQDSPASGFQISNKSSPFGKLMIGSNPLSKQTHQLTAVLSPHLPVCTWTSYSNCTLLIWFPKLRLWSHPRLLLYFCPSVWIKCQALQILPFLSLRNPHPKPQCQSSQSPKPGFLSLLLSLTSYFMSFLRTTLASITLCTFPVAFYTKV